MGKDETNSTKRETPWSIIFIQVLYFLIGGFFFYGSLAGLYFIIVNMIAGNGEGILFSLAMVFLFFSFGSFYIFAGIRLKRGMPWARRVIKILSWIMLVGYLWKLIKDFGLPISTITSTMAVIINCLIIYYLTWNKRVINFLKEQDKKRYTYRCTHCKKAFDSEEEGNEHLKTCEKRKVK